MQTRSLRLVGYDSADTSLMGFLQTTLWTSLEVEVVVVMRGRNWGTRTEKPMVGWYWTPTWTERMRTDCEVVGAGVHFQRCEKRPGVDG